MLEIKDLFVSVEGKEVLHGVSLTFVKGEVHALMGPNGAGKSTLAKVIMGHPKFKVVSGSVILDGKDVLAMPVEDRAAAGLFMSFQNPMEISGVRIRKFLREISPKKIPLMEFKTYLDEKMSLLGLDSSFASRYLNVGMSGGEKKRMEMLQMLVMEPTFALLDETDSGLDIDALKVVGGIVEKLKDVGFIVITHYPKFLETLKVDKVSVMFKGKIVAQGGKELASKIESEGFGGFYNE